MGGSRMQNELKEVGKRQWPSRLEFWKQKQIAITIDNQNPFAFLLKDRVLPWESTPAPFAAH